MLKALLCILVLEAMSVCKSIGGIEYSITDIHVFYRIFRISTKGMTTCT